ncbi:MAG TPA: DoxX family protein [Myxococcota bacterium]|nr:DoxX family protein [Myxococcota bacterium]
MTQRLDARLDTYSSPVLGIFRIVIGLMFALHGTSKLFNWPATKMGAIPTGTWPYWYGGVIELVVGLLVLLGLFTRLAALLGSGEMAFAYFTEHQPQGLLPIQNGGELAVLYCFSFLLIAFAGAGAWAVQRHAKPHHNEHPPR